MAFMSIFGHNLIVTRMLEVKKKYYCIILNTAQQILYKFCIVHTDGPMGPKENFLCILTML